MKLKDYVLQVLSTEVWQSGLEIHKAALELKIAQKDWGPVSFLISLFSKKYAAYWMRQSAIVSTYVILTELEDAGQVSKRQRVEPEEKLAVRGGYPLFEYKLRESGLRKKAQKLALVPQFG